MMYFDRFDIVGAYNLFAALFGWDHYTHGIIARIARIARLRARRLPERVQDLSPNAKVIFGGLARRHCPTVVALGRFERRARGRAGAGLSSFERVAVRRCYLGG